MQLEIISIGLQLKRASKVEQIDFFFLQQVEPLLDNTNTQNSTASAEKSLQGCV
jgi:hypothetical protein